MRRSQWYYYLIVEKGIVDEARIIFVHKDFDDDSYDFAYLMVDETLPFYFEFKPFCLQFTLKLMDQPFCLRVFCFDAFRIVMEIMSPNKFRATAINFFHQFCLLSFSQSFFIVGEVIKWTQITISSWFDELSDIKSSYDFSNAVDDYFCVFKNLFQSNSEFIFLQKLRLVVKFLRNCKQTGDSIEDCMNSFVSASCSPPFVSFYEFEVIIGWEKILFEKPFNE